MAKKGNMLDSDCLYRKNLPVYVNTRQNKDHSRTSYIKITISEIAVRSQSLRKELRIQLTDDNDPSFLLNLTIGEDDYVNLKRQEKLLVDFVGFPQELISYLEECVDATSGGSKPTYQLHLTLALGHGSYPATLEIVQILSLRPITYLTLQLLPATEAEINQYLVSCLQTLKVEYEQGEQERSRLLKSLETAESNLRRCERETERAESEYRVELCNLRSRLAEDFGREKELLVQEKRELQRQHDNEIRSFERQRSDDQYDWSAKIGVVQNELREVTSRNAELESALSETRSSLAKAKEAHYGCGAREETLRRYGEELQQMRSDQEKTIAALRGRVAALEATERDREQRLEKQFQLVEECQKNKSKAEGECERLQVRIRKREAQIKYQDAEMKRSNDVIANLSADVSKSNKMNIEYRTELEKQCEQLKKFEEENKRLTSEMTALGEKLKITETKCNMLEGDLGFKKEEIEKLEKDSKTNKNVIDYLHRQINEELRSTLRTPGMTVGSPPYLFPPAPASYLPTPSSAASSGSLQPYHYAGGLASNGTHSSDGHTNTDQITGFTTKDNKENDPPLDPKYYLPQSSTTGSSTPTLAAKRNTRISPAGIARTASTRSGLQQAAPQRFKQTNTLIPSTSSAYFNRFSASKPS